MLANPMISNPMLAKRISLAIKLVFLMSIAFPLSAYDDLPSPGKSKIYTADGNAGKKKPFKSIEQYYLQSQSGRDYADPLDDIAPDKKEAAGVLVFAKHQGETKVLLGRSYSGWGSFAGKRKYKRSLAAEAAKQLGVAETQREAAARECFEECRGVYSMVNIYHQIDEDRRIGEPDKSFVLYTAELDYVDVDVFYEIAVPLENKAMRECTGYCWIPLVEFRSLVERQYSGRTRHGDLPLNKELVKSLHNLQPKGWAKLFK
ncbi:MAG: NUDIX hydrolase [Planctomycetota bacterium]